MKRSGICVAGNMIVDILYPVTGLPKPGELTTIKEGISRTTGGALNNVIMDFAALDPALPLTALGRVGTDAEGDFVLSKLRRFGNIDLSHIKREGKTAFTAVMQDESTKQRTFFHYRGADDLFCEDDIDWDQIESEFLHIAYILLLEALDQEDAEYGTKMARLLKSAQGRGIKTSIDVVSEAGNRFKRLVPPALKYTDYCIINEIEAGQSTGIALRDGAGRLIESAIPDALGRLFGMGVSTWAVIHCPEGGFGMDASGSYEQVESLKLPEGYIKGTVGAGDAFCAGALYAAYKKRSLREGIEMGIASAACSLSQSGSTEGMRSAGEAMKLYRSLR